MVPMTPGKVTQLELAQVLKVHLCIPGLGFETLLDTKDDVFAHTLGDLTMVSMPIGAEGFDLFVGDAITMYPAELRIVSSIGRIIIRRGDWVVPSTAVPSHLVVGNVANLPKAENDGCDLIALVTSCPSCSGECLLGDDITCRSGLIERFCGMAHVDRWTSGHSLVDETGNMFFFPDHVDTTHDDTLAVAMPEGGPDDETVR